MSNTTPHQRARMAGRVDASDAVGNVSQQVWESLKAGHRAPLPRWAMCELLTGIADVDPAHRRAYALGIVEALEPFIEAGACVMTLKQAKTGGTE
jgi:hypothetical protein